MIELLKALLGVDNRPEWAKEKDRKLIAAIKEAGDDLYVGPNGVCIVIHSQQSTARSFKRLVND